MKQGEKKVPSVIDSQAYLEKMLAVKRPGTETLLAFYEHRVGAICTDPALLLCPLDDHIVHRGDGCFETLKYNDRRVYQMDAHIKRMQKSAAAIQLAPPCSWQDVIDISFAVARAGVETSGRTSGALRILLGRGPGGFALTTRECPESSLYIVAYATQPFPQQYYDKGVTAFRTTIPAKQDWFATIKSVNYLPNALMKLEAETRGYDYPICFDDNDFLAEGATENMCFVDTAGTLVVPEFTNAIAGTTLVRAIELLEGVMPVRFDKITEAELFTARELLVFSTTGDCTAIVRYNDKPIHDGRPGPVAEKIRQLIQQDMQENTRPF